MSGRCESEVWVKGEKCGLLDSPGIILTCNSHRISWAHLKSKLSCWLNAVRRPFKVASVCVCVCVYVCE